LALQPDGYNIFLTALKLMARWTRYIIAGVVAWLALFCLVSAMPVFSGVMTWQRSLGDTLVQWFPWALLSPVIFWLVLRFPIGRPGIGWRIFFHVISGVALIMFAAWLSTYLLEPQIMKWMPQDMDQGPPFAGPTQDQPNWNDHPPFHDRHQGGPPPPWGPFHDRGPHGPPIWARVSFNVPIYVTLLSLSHTFIYFRRSQQRERRTIELESQLDRSRLQALRMQLQPHFLFNTLNAISTLVRADPGKAQEMIGSLGQMLRLSLDSGSAVEVRLEEELKFLNSYLEIAQIRFGDRLQIKRNIPPLEVLNAYVPTFILQPLVENALKHGIEPRASTGTLEILLQRSEDRLLLSVSDTGVGLADATGLATSNGIGLSNTKARLQNLYPGQFHFSVRNRPEGGCIAAVEIPFHIEPITVEHVDKTS
jgi:two-component sensor histidine kinase